jgi:signal transduction histidine kinase
VTSLDAPAAVTGARRRWNAGSVGPGVRIAVASAVVLALTAAVTVIGLSSPIVDRPVLFTGLRSIASVGLLAIAVSAVARGSSERFAAMLVVGSFTFALTGLTAADAPVPFMLGRCAAAAGVLVTAYIALAYPRSRLDLPASRRFLPVAAAGTVVLLGANLLLSHYPPVAGPFVRCSGTDCPPNPLAIADLSGDAQRALSSLLGLWTALIAATTALLVARRAGVATRLQRRSIGPVLAWALVMATGYATYIAVRTIEPGSPVLTPAAVSVAGLLSLMPFAMALGIARGRVFATSGLERMLGRLGDGANPRVLQQAMADAFDDATLRLLVRLPGDDRYVDVRGDTVTLPDDVPAGGLTQIERNGRTVAMLVHDPAMAEEPEVLEAAGSALLLALENASLEARLRESAAELEESRERVARAALLERERIEHDLHDGAQQQLIALRIRLVLLEERAADDPLAVVPELARAGRDIELALEQIRRLAHGIYPAELRDIGIGPALRSAARGLPVAVAVHDATRRRFAVHVETAVYFCCLEALQNAVKHGGTGVRIDVRLTQSGNGDLMFEVADDGRGFEPERVRRGSYGLTGMRDRLSAVGGRLTVRSVRGAGTTVAGRVHG